MIVRATKRAKIDWANASILPFDGEPRCGQVLEKQLDERILGRTELKLEASSEVDGETAVNVLRGPTY